MERAADHQGKTAASACADRPRGSFEVNLVPAGKSTIVIDGFELAGICAGLSIVHQAGTEIPVMQLDLLAVHRLVGKGEAEIEVFLQGCPDSVARALLASLQKRFA
jgi:hypothetical protein